MGWEVWGRVILPKNSKKHSLGTNNGLYGILAQRCFRCLVVAGWIGRGKKVGQGNDKGVGCRYGLPA